MKTSICLWGALGWVLATPLVAEAARISLAGRVALTSATPIEDARITVTFHGHEIGIHEYTTERRRVTRTDEQGRFDVFVKVPEDRYIWTHATVEVAETETSKSTTAIAPCVIDDQGGGFCSKEFRVNPLIEP
ncbi:MAG: hypothetical protein AAF892_08680 [Cyanobacteria bacterium P01_D01_bin.71]